MNLNPIQLFDAESSTYTYILSGPADHEAVIIDPVARHWERDLRHLERLNLTLAYILETHAHADHVTSAGKLREIGWEKQHNARLSHRSKEQFMKLMLELHLPKPKLIDIAVPANQNLGLPHGA